MKSTGQVAVLATSFAKRSPRVLVDAECSDELALEVAAHGRLDLIGLHCQLGAADAASLAEIVVGMIARMARISRKHGRILSRISLGDVDLMPGVGDPRILRRVAEAVDQAVEDGCIRFRYARPVLTAAPCRSALLPSR